MALRAEGVRVRQGPLGVTFLPGDPTEGRRVAFGFNRRLGNAVVRNRLRRRLRASLAGLITSDPTAVPFGAMILTAEPAVIRCSPADLDTEVAGLFATLRRRQRGSRP